MTQGLMMNRKIRKLVHHSQQASRRFRYMPQKQERLCDGRN